MSNEQDPMEFMKNLWGNMGFALPGMVTPTLDTNELDKRITELKTVEGWLKTNLGLLQMAIHGLDMQRNTLAAMQAMSESANKAAESGENPFTNPALWPWPFMPQADAAAGATSATGSKAASASEKPKKKT